MGDKWGRMSFVAHRRSRSRSSAPARGSGRCGARLLCLFRGSCASKCTRLMVGRKMHTACPYGYINLCFTSVVKSSASNPCTNVSVQCPVTICRRWMCAYVIESHMRMSLKVTCGSTTPTASRWGMCCRPPNMLHGLHIVNPRQRRGMLPTGSSRRHNPYLFHWPPQGLPEVHPVVGAIVAATTTVTTIAVTVAATAIATTPLAPAAQSIALPRVHHAMTCGGSPNSP